MESQRALKKRIGIVFGTRPELIKLAPVIWSLQPSHDVEVICTGQHLELLEGLDTYFGVEVTHHFSVMTKNQSLNSLLSKLIGSLGQLFHDKQYDLIIAQGDTSSVLASALAAFQSSIPFAHVEAGLRSGNLESPFPEEMNRVVTSRLAQLHFCPTKRAAQNLHAESVGKSSVFVTGNTVIDSLLYAHKKNGPHIRIRDKRKLIVATVHRRENHGRNLQQICRAIHELADDADVEILIPVHPNPQVEGILQRYFAGHRNVTLSPPLAYPTLIQYLAESYLVLTDSGGLQEESPSLKKPVVILREETERQEVLECGAGCLVGADKNRIVSVVKDLLYDENKYASMIVESSPFGDGKSGERIANIIGKFFAKSAANQI